MKRFLILSVVLALLFSVLPAGEAAGQSSSGTTWTSVIAYFAPKGPNPPDSISLSVMFYSLDEPDGIAMNPSSLLIYRYQSGKLLVGQTISGSAVVSATQPIFAVYRQEVAGRTPYSPVLYTSFEDGQFDSVVYITSVQLNRSYDSQIGIQNVDSDEEIDLTLKFYKLDGSLQTSCDGSKYAPLSSVPGSSSVIVKASNCLSGTFDGSLVIEAEKTGGGPADIVAAVQDVQIKGRRAYAYEGSGENSGATTLYMPSAMCSYGKNRQTTFYAVQNMGGSPTNVTIEFFNSESGQKVAEHNRNNLPANAKFSLSTCDRSVLSGTNRKSLTARITSSGEPLAALGKVYSRDGMQTAFIGQPAPGSGAPYKLALPYVEWDRQTTGLRAYIAVMNAGGSPAQDVKATYYNSEGSPVSEHTLAADGSPINPNAKRNSDPQGARALDARSAFNGAVIIESDQPLVAVVRMQRAVRGVRGIAVLGEDYNAIAYTDTE